LAGELKAPGNYALITSITKDYSTPVKMMQQRSALRIPRTLVVFMILSIVASPFFADHIHLAKQQTGHHSHSHGIEAYIIHEASHHDSIDDPQPYAGTAVPIELDQQGKLSKPFELPAFLALLLVALTVLVSVCRRYVLALRLQPHPPDERYRRFLTRAPPCAS